MAMVGGYVSVDCKGLDLKKGSTPQKIDGLYARLKSVVKTGKPVVAHNCKWVDNDTSFDVTPVSVLVIDFGDVFIATSATLQIIVGADDYVTINNLVGGE